MALIKALFLSVWQSLSSEWTCTWAAQWLFDLNETEPTLALLLTPMFTQMFFWAKMAAVKRSIEKCGGFNNKQLKDETKKVRSKLNSNIQHILLLCSKDGKINWGRMCVNMSFNYITHWGKMNKICFKTSLNVILPRLLLSMHEMLN